MTEYETRRYAKPHSPPRQNHLMMLLLSPPGNFGQLLILNTETIPLLILSQSQWIGLMNFFTSISTGTPVDPGVLLREP